MSGKVAWRADFLASWVVFLVALPLSIGIAVASGVPEERAAAVGILSAIVSGFVTGLFAGSPLQISGPAAGLIVVTYEISQKVGWEGLALAVMLTGLFQVVGGLLRWGGLFRAVTPGMIEGMMSGIGMIILLTQVYRLIGLRPPGEGLALGGFVNLIRLPSSLLALKPERLIEVGLAMATLTLMSLWARLAPSRLKVIPAALVSLLGAVVIAQVLPWPVTFLSFDGRWSGAIQLPHSGMLSYLLSPVLWQSAFVLTFIASAKGLLTAAAIDTLQTHAPRTRFNRELMAEGTANLSCGFLGLLPITGEVARSSANVLSGAQTARSNLLHAGWMLLFLMAFPAAFKYLPQAAISGLLIAIALKLLNLPLFWKLSKESPSESFVFLTTFLLGFGIDLLLGILGGLLIAFFHLTYRLSQLRIRVKYGGQRHIHLHLSGAATFLQLPGLTALFQRLPKDAHLHIRGEALLYIDFACRSYFSQFAKELEAQGGRLYLHIETPPPLAKGQG
jgi:MFS superfamily sulfate permease-like transporter